MNHSIKLLVLIFIALFSSCSSNDDENSNENANKGFLKIGDQSVELSQGYLENYGVRGNAYNIDFSLKSKSISGTENGAVETRRRRANGQKQSKETKEKK